MYTGRLLRAAAITQSGPAKKTWGHLQLSLDVEKKTRVSTGRVRNKNRKQYVPQSERKNKSVGGGGLVVPVRIIQYTHVLFRYSSVVRTKQITCWYTTLPEYNNRFDLIFM